MCLGLPSLMDRGFIYEPAADGEPGTNEEIKKFVTKKFGVTFDMFSKIKVNGKSAHPLWKFLESEQPGFLTNDIKWNLTKFLVNKEGIPVKRYGPKTPPKEIEKDLPQYW